MKFTSTRAASPDIGLSAAIAAGLAPDGGLYVPDSLPRFAPSDFDGDETLPQIATRLLTPFFAGDALARQP